MLGNYLRTTLRLMVRDRTHSVIHLFGLALGLGTCLVIGQFVRHEAGFDDFHVGADRLVRVLNTAPGRVPGVQQPSTLGPTLLNELSGVEAVIRFDGQRYDKLTHAGEVTDYENGLIYADANLFEEFSFSLVLGDSGTALIEPYTLVITPRIARKYFGDTNPIGQRIRFDDRMEMTVTGVVASPPINSSIQFDMIGSFATLNEENWMIKNNPWNLQSFPTYLRLADGADPDELASRIPAVVGVHTKTESVVQATYRLEPLRSIYLHSQGGDGGLGLKGDSRDVYLFATTAALVLLLACINYTNLATAKATRRAREVGVRKAIGAHATGLRLQFIGEAVGLCLIAGALGAAFAELGTGFLQQLEAISLPDLPWTDPIFLLCYVGVTLLTGLMSGAYPAFVLSRYEVVTAVRHKPGTAGSRLLRRGLVVAQFTVATALLIGVLVIREQLQFIQDQRLGLQIEQVLSVHNHGGLTVEQSRVVRQELMRHPAVLSASASTAMPSRGQMARTVEIEGSTDEHWIAQYNADEALVNTLGIEITQGRGLTQEDEMLRERHLVINEAAAQSLGWDEPVGETITFNGNVWPVVGVMADFHTESLRSSVWPLMMAPSDEWFSYLLVRLDPERLVAGIDHVKTTWAEFVPDRPFQTSWLDESFALLYQKEQQLRTLFTVFCGIAMLIACVGLYGLAAYSAQSRTTEIGVRKVFGASATGLTTRLTADFLLLVAIGLGLGAPLAWYMTQQWLQEFAYRIDMGPASFVLAAVLVTLVAAVTVSHQSIRAALADPIKSLRHE